MSDLREAIWHAIDDAPSVEFYATSLPNMDALADAVLAVVEAYLREHDAQCVREQYEANVKLAWASELQERERIRQRIEARIAEVPARYNDSSEAADGAGFELQWVLEALGGSDE